MKHRANITGFTLIEILIVVAIIGIIAAISIPALLRTRMSANQASTQGALKTITSAQVDYYNNASPRTYAVTLELLGTGQDAGEINFIDGQLSEGIKAGYTFDLVAGALNNGRYYTWSVAAWPVSYRRTGTFSMYIDDTGIMRAGDIGGAKPEVDLPIYSKN